MWGSDDKPKRKPIGKTEWDAVKAVHGYKCIVCHKTEKTVGTLEKAHLKAHCKGGTQLVPMCPNCHGRYDKKQLTEAEKLKLGIDDKKLNKLAPKKPVAKKKGLFDI